MIKFKNTFLNVSAIAAMAFTAACTNQDDPIMEVIPMFGEGDNVVTITVQPEDLSFGTRGEVDPSNTISNGNKADVLYFAVYRKIAGADSNVDWEVDETFQKEGSKSLNFTNAPTKVDANTGQNIFKIDDRSKFFPFRIQLVTEEGYNYKVAFWAQSHESKAFGDVSKLDLKEITVKYEDITNNYELADAFTGVTDQIIGGEKGTTHGVILKRPFAQINLGTTGADYKNLMINPILYPNLTVKYTSVNLKGDIYNKFNVVEDDVIESSEQTSEVTLKWNNLASYVNFKADELPKVTSGDNLTPEAKYAEFLHKSGEEMLYVKLRDQAGSTKLLDYKTAYPTLDEDGSFLTETFKYLSMTYVLVKKNGGDNSNVIDQVNFKLSDSDGTSTSTAKNPVIWLKLKNVPATRNWRTNILCGLSKTKDDEPQDETSIFSSSLICVHLDPLYDGEKSGLLDYGKEKEDDEEKKSYVDWKKAVTNKFTHHENVDPKYDYEDDEDFSTPEEVEEQN